MPPKSESSSLPSAPVEPVRPWFSLQRLLLIGVTVLVALVLGQSLASSWNQPQVANQLQLYQTDLLLKASVWSGDSVPPDQWQTIRQGILGQEPLVAATKQYTTVRQDAVDALARVQPTPVTATTDPAAADPDSAEPATPQDAAPKPDLATATDSGKPLSRRQQTALAQEQALIHRLDLRLGLLEVSQDDPAAARQRWQTVAEAPTASAAQVATAAALQQLWPVTDTPLAADAEPALTADLTPLQGWFRYRALERLYERTDQPQALAQLRQVEQATAQASLGKLAVVGTLPVVGAISGLGLLGWLGVQRWLRGREALLMRHAGAGWTVPWGGETIWQVLVVGFFFVGQIAIPLLLSGFAPALTGLGSRGRALYAMVYYLLMSAGGLGVLAWCLRRYRPLPEGWFTLKPRASALAWGLGGYLVALPLMLGVSLLNQQLWDGQGGSNPLLQTVLQEQDPVALLLFFLTAAVAAPLFEEVLFRGFLLPSLTRYLPLSGAIALSSLVFAAAHLSLSEVLPLTALGALLGFVYSRSRNLLAPMVLHSAWNSATMLGLFILGS